MLMMCAEQSLGNDSLTMTRAWLCLLTPRVVIAKVLPVNSRGQLIRPSELIAGAAKEKRAIVVMVQESGLNETYQNPWRPGALCKNPLK